MAIRNKKPNRNGLVKSAESKLRYENKELKERIEALEKQLSIHGVVKSLKDKYTNEFWFWMERFESEDDSNRLWWYKKDLMLSTEEMWQEYNRLKTTL